MQEVMKQSLQEAGMDVDGALERLMGSETLLDRLLNMFLDDTNYGRLQAAVDHRDLESALAASHTLKGMCGNLSMTLLFDLLTRQVALFRADDWAGGAGLMPEIAAAYDRLSSVIKQI